MAEPGPYVLPFINVTESVKAGIGAMTLPE
jgi:hypothetical protein